MKLTLLIEMLVVALLAVVPCSALKSVSVGGGEGQKVVKGPDFEPFRSDTTLGFMRKIHARQAAVKQEAEAARSQLCTQHGFKAAERAGCVAFMHQACHDVRDSNVSQDSCLHFFQEEQPAYSKESKEDGSYGNPFQDLQKGPNYDSKKAQKGAAKAADGPADAHISSDPTVSGASMGAPDSLQHGPNYDSKKAQKGAAKAPGVKVEEKREDEDSSEDSSEDSGAGMSAPDSLQHGPQYDSKKAQKAADKVDEKNDKAGPRKTKGIVEVLNPFGTGWSVGNPFKDAQKGPNYHKKMPKKKEEEKKEHDEHDEPEEKEVREVPGCKNSPKGWEDSKGNDCEDYAEGEWCTRRGGYGDAWLDEWGTFEDRATKGKSAKEVCCICGGGFNKDEEAEEASKEKKTSGSAGSAPAAAAAPAGAPSPAGPILGSKSGRALQEQGYSGELVAHEDQVTMTEDWGREFGPRAGHRDIKTICLETPGNEWCSLHGYYDKPKSGAAAKTVAVVLAALVLACLP